jgi:magnesium chelatase subunit D
MLEAAKFQVARRVARRTGRRDDRRDHDRRDHDRRDHDRRDHDRREDGRLLISPADLRAHRRAPEPGRLLVLVLDHTCRRDWDWMPALTPYVRWAYAARAAVCVVDVGLARARHELRAQAYATASLRDRRVAASLERDPDGAAGRATPLAHAIELAGRELRRRVQHGRAAVEQAWLVVASDGRGNVPLAASLAGEVRGRVAREGVADALAAATRIRHLPRVASVVVSPGGPPYRRLAFDLADALGGTVVTGGAGG